MESSPGPVVTTTGRGCVSPPGLMNANLCGSICLYCISGHMWPLQPSSLTRGRPPRPLLPRPKPRWRRGAKRLDEADVRCEGSSDHILALVAEEQGTTEHPEYTEA
jgi:hypothetical protein